MEQLEYPRVYYHGYRNLDDFIQVMRRLEERNEFFVETESELHLTWNTSVTEDGYIIEVILWKE